MGRGYGRKKKMGKGIYVSGEECRVCKLGERGHDDEGFV